MKWMFILLLLINVVYFGWELERQAGIARRRPVAVNSIPSSSRQLLLITEKEAGDQVLKAPVAPLLDAAAGGAGEQGAEAAAPAPAVAVSDAPDTDNDPGLVAELPDIDITGIDAGPGKYYCFSFGPLEEQIMALGLSDWFKTRRATASMRFADRQGRQLLWMYLSPQDSRTEAMDTIRELKDRGISDYRLIDRGNLENAISLGLFSSQAAVNGRLRELQQQGYKPIVVPYYDNKRIFWVDVRLKEIGVPLETVFEGFPSRYNYVPVDCDKIAMDASAP